MNQAPNIAKSIRNLFLASTTLPGLIPGGILYGRQPSPETRPFALMFIEPDGEPDYQTGQRYEQDYTLTIVVPTNAALANAATIQQALDQFLSPVTKLDSLTNNAWTLAIYLEPFDLTEAQERLVGQFTFISGARWQIQLQEQTQ